MLIRDQILVQLYKAGLVKESETVHIIRTQEGLADKLEKQQPQIAKSIKELINDGLIESFSAYVPGAMRKRKAYILTSEGVQIAKKLMQDANEPIYTEYICDQDRCPIGNPCHIKIEDEHKKPKPKCILKGRKTQVEWKKVSK